ncbi:MAG TPA: sulfide dehydrogenase [Dongiaceae bacterium]
MARPILAILLFVSAMPLAEAAPPTPPPGAASCSGCHPTSKSVNTPVARLVGRSAAEIEAAMQEFRTGQKPASVMDRIAKGFSADEIAAIAAWYAAQKD